MRIISIACRNINSLRGAERHELDFEKLPLEGCGLFAILGPTGAGKTTLLDALTLALYNQTPRQKQSQALLSNGEAEGWAEVVYEVEAGRFLSRWSVQRARKQRGGNLQTAVMEVSTWPDAAGRAAGRQPEIIAQKLTESVRKNVELTGLDYEQFTRSVLLAQGGFAEFLKAKDDERAGLLERMTGTAIYKELSKQAHARKGLEEAAEDRLTIRLGAVQLFDDEELARQTNAAATLKVQTAVAADAEETRKKQAEWHRRLAELQANQTEAAAAAEAAEAARAAEAPALERLAAHEAVEPFEEAWRTAQNTERQGRESAEEVHKLETKAKGAATQCVEAEKIVADSTAEAKAAADALAAHKPALDAAKAQVPLLENLGRQVSKAGDDQQALRKELTDATDRLATTEKTLEAADTERNALADWLQAHAADRDLGPVIGEAKRLTGLREKLRADYAERHGTRAPLQKELDAAAQKEQANAQTAAQAATDLRLLAAEETALHAQHAAQAAAARARAAHVAAQLAPAQTANQALRRLLVSTELLADHAAALAPGCACPLCGALEHPVLALGVDASEEAQEALRGEIGEAEDLVTRLLAEQTATQSLLALLQSVPVLAPPLTLAGAGSATAPAVAADANAANATAATRSATQLLREINDLPTRRAGLAGEGKRAQDAVLEARRQQAGLQGQIDELNRKLAALQAEGQALNDELAALAAAHGTAFVPAQAAALEAGLRERLAVFNEKNQRHATLETSQRDAQAALTSLREKHGTLTLDTEKARLAHANLAAEHAELQAKIAAAHPHFATPAAAFAHYETAAENARQRLENQTQTLTKLAERRTAATAAAAAEATRRDAALAEATTQFAALDAALAAAGLPPRDVLRLGATLLPPDERPRLRGLRTRFDQAVGTAQTLARQLAADHARTRALALSPEPPEAVETAYAEAQAAHQDLRDQLLLLRQALANDADHRLTHANLSEELQAQRAETRRWRNLHELIGHSEGVKFSRFAQGLTLARLVDLANQHLRQFNDRYQLARRDATTLGLLVADSYDDCTRDVSTLSGGETFLVSLALALGLAELASANAARLDSLFIDEGFGTLDPDTLDLALAALGSLRRRGKTIGIITHVPPESLRDYIDTHVIVERVGPGSSRLRLVG